VTAVKYKQDAAKKDVKDGAHTVAAVEMIQRNSHEPPDVSIVFQYFIV
jgi:hypothetical protein